MAEVFNAYLDADKSDRFLLKLAQHWKDTLVAEVYPETIRKAAKLIYSEANEPTWNRQVIKPTQAAINYAAGLGWCPRISVKRYTEDPEIKTPATIAWVRAFHAQALEDGLPHLGALCMFMFGTAARVGESCRMTWGDVDLSQGTAKLYLFKPTPWNRVAHLQPELVAAMANLPTNRKADELVFDYTGRGSLRGAWNNVCKRADIERLTPHCCRHGFATSMLQAGYDVKTVAERGGWKDAATVLRTYAHAIKDRSVTNVLFDTPAAQEAEEKNLTIGKIRHERRPSLEGCPAARNTPRLTGAQVRGCWPAAKILRKSGPTIEGAAMYTISILASPARADLDDDTIVALQLRWDGGHAIWLDHGTAAEFAVEAPPADFDEVWAQLDGRGFDLAVQPAAGRRKAVLLADMDSTMIGQECIDELADMAGVGPRVAAITARAMNGELNFHESLVERVALLEGLPDSVIAQVLETRISLAAGGPTLVATMKANGAWTALVSGGFTAFTGPVADRIGFDEQRANVLLSDDSGRLSGRVALPILGREAKAEALQEITAARGLTVADAIAVGDGANDLGMLQLAGTGVALHAKPVVAAQAPIRINHGDLTALLYLQGYGRDEFVAG